MNQQKDICLKLHKSSDNTVFVVNTASIVYINIPKGAHTEIYTLPNEELASVNESPDKIINQIHNICGNDNGFIRIHRFDDNSIQYFNLKYFITAENDDSNPDTTTITLHNFLQMTVNETPEKIFNLISHTFDNSESDKV